jgi:hypothetical protein
LVQPAIERLKDKGRERDRMTEAYLRDRQSLEDIEEND